MMGNHVIHQGSRYQAIIALSSAEAELNASVKGASEGIYLRNTAKAAGMNLSVTLFGDSSAAEGIMSRTRAGPVKHLDFNMLWTQEKGDRGEVQATQTNRGVNVADSCIHARGKKERQTDTFAMQVLRGPFSWQKRGTKPEATKTERRTREQTTANTK